MSSEKEKITAARITPLPKSMLDALPEVWVTLESGPEIKLFDYYPDEISFRPEEFIGLTLAEAVRLKFNKDRNFLRS